MSKQFASKADLAEKQTSFIKLSDHAYAYTAEGDPNSGVIVGDNACMVIDTTATPAMAQSLIARIREVTDKPIKYVVLSHYHAVRVLGASAYYAEGAQEIIASRGTWELIVEPFFDNGGNDVGLAWQILASLERVAYGYLLAVIAGVSLGVLVGQSTWALRGLDPIFQVLRTVPPLAWLPISLAGFQDSNPSAIFVIFITAIWPIIINTSVGIRNIPEDYRNVARVIRLNGVEYFWKIMLPAAAPYIFSGLRIGVGLSWLAIIAAEMLIGGVGIGFFIWDAWNASRISDIILALVYVGVVGFLLDRTVAWVGKRVTRGTSPA